MSDDGEWQCIRISTDDCSALHSLNILQNAVVAAATTPLSSLLACRRTLHAAVLYIWFLCLDVLIWYDHNKQVFDTFPPQFPIAISNPKSSNLSFSFIRPHSDILCVCANELLSSCKSFVIWTRWFASLTQPNWRSASSALATSRYTNNFTDASPIHAAHSTYSAISTLQIVQPVKWFFTENSHLKWSLASSSTITSTNHHHQQQCAGVGSTQQ